MVETKVNNTIFINGNEVEFSNERNLLEVIQKTGIDIPTFCYRPDLTLYGACRMCVVEVEGRGIHASCTMPPEPGLKIKTNSERVRRVRKVSLELLLSNHDRECTTCERSGDCELQILSNKYDVKDLRFEKLQEKAEIDDTNPSLVRDSNKCILCGACIRACTEVQGKSVLGFSNRGSKTVCAPAYGNKLEDVDCVYCGQCAAVCPTGALSIKSDVDKVFEAINDDNKTVIVQIAPAVRVALGEQFNIPAGENIIGIMAAALRRVGINKVFDTSFSADVTIMEEGTELIGRLKNNEKLPLFTSCCPAWVRHAEQNHKNFLKNLSTAKSPQQMFGALAKDVLCKEYNVEPKDFVVVSIMPCTAKKAEAVRPEFSENGVQEVDIVLTTQEVFKLIQSAGINISKLTPEEMDMPFGEHSGAGVIFGASGGVAEAALRTAYEVITGKTLENVNFEDARGLDTLKEFTVDLGGKKIKIAIINTLAEADRVIEKINKGEAHYDVIEVMACPGGCIGGAGQPVSCKDRLIKGNRKDGLYKADAKMKIKKSHENPSVKTLYDKHLGEPNSEKAHHLLHTEYEERDIWNVEE